MNTRKKLSLFGLPLWVIVLALGIGLAIGSFDRFGSAPATGVEGKGTGVPAPVETRSAERDSNITAGRERVVRPQPATVSTPTEPGEQVRATEGLVVEAARIDNRFVGYRVISNRDDPRMKVGDIVVSIDGNPVEDSAAGSELFIAALSDRNATIETYNPASDN